MQQRTAVTTESTEQDKECTEAEARAVQGGTFGRHCPRTTVVVRLPRVVLSAVKGLHSNPSVSSLYSEPSVVSSGQSCARTRQENRERRPRTQFGKLPGLAYSQSEYDTGPYSRLREIAAEIVAAHTAVSKDLRLEAFGKQIGYATPKVDVCAAVICAARSASWTRAAPT